MSSDPGTVFNAAVGPVDVVLQGPDSVWKQQDPGAIQLDVQDTRTIDPVAQVNGTGWARTFEFDLPADHDRATMLRLLLTIPALTTTDGSYRRFCDNAYTWIEKVEYNMTSQTVQTIYPEYRDMCDWYLQNKYEDRLKFNNAVAADLTAAERNVRATGTQYLDIPLRFYWDGNPGAAPINYALQQPPRIKVYMKALENIVQTDGTAPVCNTTSVQLRNEAVHVNDDQRAEWIAMVKSEGFRHQFEDILIESRKSIASGSTSAGPYQLTNTKAPQKELFMLFRRQANFTALACNYTSINERDLPSEIEIKCSTSDRVYSRIDVRRTLKQWRENARHTTGGTNILALPWAYAPEMKNASTGFVDFNYLPNPTITFYWGTLGQPALAADLYLDMFCKAYSFISEKDQTIMRMFTF